MEFDKKCTKCGVISKEPKVLPCLHSFCTSPCLEELAAQDPKEQFLTCPSCEYQVTLPENGVAGFQNDLHAQRLQQTKKLLEKHICDNCCQNGATRYCCKCEKFMCDRCTRIHGDWGDFKDHKLMTTDEVRANPRKLGQDQTSKCAKHELDTRLYCETCSVLICEDCKNGIHEGHNTEDIKDAYEKTRTDLVMGLTRFEEKLPVIEEFLETLTDRVSKIKSYSLNTPKSIDEKINELQQLLEVRREHLKAEVKHHTNKELNDLTAQKASVEFTHEKIKRWLKHTKDCLKYGTEGEVVTMKTLLTNQIQEIHLELNLEPQQQFFMELVTDEHTKRACDEFGKIECDPISAENTYATGEGTRFAIKGVETTVEVHPMTKRKKKFAPKFTLTGELVLNESTAAIECDLDQNNERPIIAYKPPSRGTYSLYIRVNGEDIQGSPFSIAVAPSLENLQPVTLIGDLYQPYRAITNSRGQIILYDSSSTKMLVKTSNGVTLFEFGEYDVKQLRKQRGVAVDRDDNIYVTNRVSNCILKFSSNGDVLATEGCKGSGALQFDNPTGICFDKANDLLYVCDRDNSRIQVLTTNLEFVKFFGKKGDGNGQFQSPSSAAFDSSNNLYVVDFENSRVQVFTIVDGELRFSRMFSKKQGRSTLCEPHSIAIDSCNIVYVSETNCINMFTINGDFIGSFGEMRKHEGQVHFNQIRGLHIDSNDFLLVSDTGNSRLQIFCLT